MKKSIILLSAIIPLLFCACKKEEVDEAFLENDNLCLIENGVTIHSYDPNTWQVGFNKDKKEFRIHTDTMSDYYVLTCQELPQEIGQEVHANLKWSGNSMTSKSNLTFKVEKMDSQGRIWLWCKKGKIAVSVMSLN